MPDEFKNFKKLQSRYWLQKPLPDPAELRDHFSKRISSIENRDFGVDEDIYIVTTQTKIIINGLSIKIYEFIKDSIKFINNRNYIAAISILRLCIEHIAMLCFFNDKLQGNIKKNDRFAIRLLLHSFCMGERIYFVEVGDKITGEKKFSTRAEHISSALRHFDKKYSGLGIQLTYDILSNHTHVSPTSSVRMLCRQKVWDEPEPEVDWRRVRLSTKSNSHEQIASVYLETVLILFKVADTEVLKKQKKLYENMEQIGKQIELASKINPKEETTLRQILSEHDRGVQNFLNKLEKYGRPH